MVHAHTPEEAQTRSKIVDAHTGIDTGTQILKTVGEGVCQLDISGGTRLLHVIAGDGDAVELGHVLGSILEDVGDNLH